jgi:hypothetical protein
LNLNRWFVNEDMGQLIWLGFPCAVATVASIVCSLFAA